MTPNGLFHLISLMLMDMAIIFTTVLGTAGIYGHYRPQLDFCTYFRLWPFPFMYVLLAALLGIYRGTWPRTKPPFDAVLTLKAHFKANCLAFLLLFGMLMFTRDNVMFSRCVLGISWFLLVWLLPSGHLLVKRLLHIPMPQLQPCPPHPSMDGLFLPIPRLFKALLEKLIALLVLLFGWPLGVILLLLVKLTSEGPAFYVSHRKGLHGKDINVLKFRTMRKQADVQLEQLLADSMIQAQEWSRNFKLDDDPRITKVGRFLRKTSLDELPQFWNVLMGDMAIIGPRPIVAEEISFYSQQQYDELVSVKPGITGLWQVLGRNDLPYEQRIQLNLYYIRHWSLWLDYYILLKTPGEIFSAHGK